MNTEQKLDLILREITEVKDDTRKINSRLDGIEHTIDEMKTEIAEIKAEQTVMKQDIVEIKAEQTAIRLLIENELRKQIRIVAEAHLDIQRHLHEMHEMYMRYEAYSLTVEHLKTDMREVKQRLSMA